MALPEPLCDAHRLALLVGLLALMGASALGVQRPPRSILAQPVCTRWAERATGWGTELTCADEPSSQSRSWPSLKPCTSLSPASALALQQPADLNAMSAKCLSLVPGIGPKLARRIVADREIHGPFATVGALRRVHGVGAKTLAAAAASLCVFATPDFADARPSITHE